MERRFIVTALCILASHLHGTLSDVCRDLAEGVDKEYSIAEVNACHECGWYKITNDKRKSFYPALTPFTKAETSRVGSPRTAWCGSDDGGDYLEIEFDQVLKLGELVIQGYDIGSWVTAFRVTYDDGAGTFSYNNNDTVFKGNSEPYRVEERKFSVPINAKAIRIHPVSHHNGACMRVDVYACEDPNEKDSYMVSKSGKSRCTLNVLEECEDLTCPRFKTDADGCEICECGDVKVGEKFESDIYLNPTTKLIVQENFGGKSTETDPGTVFKGASRIYGKWFDYKSGGKIIVPYILSAGLSSVARRAIDAGIAHLASRTCIQLQRRSNQPYFINFVVGGGCSSPIGKSRGGNQVSIGRGCEHMGIVVHEIMHSLGFWHEQSRPDRDSYVRINYGNIVSGMAYNFQKRSPNDIDSLGSPYDLRSLMHYGPNGFSANGRPTITQLNGGRDIGQRSGLSTEDIKQINKMYGCDGTGTGTGQTTRPTPRPTARPRTTTRPTGKCEDENQNCPSWAIRGECDINPGYMKVKCKKSCNICGESCTDDNRNCPRWKQYCDSAIYSAYMHKFCKSTCGKC